MPVTMKKAPGKKSAKATITPAPASDHLKVVDVPVASLVEYENNPRINDHAVDAMADLIKTFGFRVPILVRENRIVDGHLRIKAARKLGMVTIPAIDTGDLSEAEERALRISMNKAAELADWDFTKLDAEFKALMGMDFDLKLTGFDAIEISKISQSAMADAAAANVVKEATAAPVAKTKDADAGKPADPAHVSMTFNMAATSRDTVHAALEAYRKKHELGNVSQALVAMAVDWASENGVKA